MRLTDRFRLFEYRANLLRPSHDLAVQVDIVLCEEIDVE